MSVDWIESFAGIDLSGAVNVLATAGERSRRPEWNGQAELRDARYIPVRFPHSFDRIQGLVLLYPDAVVLDHLRSDLAGGTVAASGRLDLAAARQAARPIARRSRRGAPRCAIPRAGWCGVTAT